jgi:dTDP-D-glucose 4,6-dehydratase
VKQLIELAEYLTGKKVPTVPAQRSGMDVRYEMSAARLRTEFDWKPLHLFDTDFHNYLSS